MERKTINVGTSVNARNGDSLRDAFIKINSNFEEIYGAVSVLGSFTDDATALVTNIQGSVLDNNGDELLSATTGKLSPSAIPDEVPKIFSFRANFNTDGSLQSITEIPFGWEVTTAGNAVTVIHTVTRPPQMVVYWGYTRDPDELRLRFPTAGYQVKVPVSNPTSVFTLNLNSAVTGADTGEYALVKVTF